MISAGHQRGVIAECSHIIYAGFLRYNRNFYRITRRARSRFEERDWKGHQQDIVERVELYEKSVQRIAAAVQEKLGQHVNDHSMWNDLRTYLGKRLENIPDAGFVKTFFNSITRRIFDTVGIDAKLEFVYTSLDEKTDLVSSLSLRRYPYWGSLEMLFETVLNDFAFGVPYSSLEKSINKIADKIDRYCLLNISDGGEYLRFEFIDTFFYQSARAYLVGRIIKENTVVPLVVAFKNTDEGIQVDAVLLAEEEVSIVFGYTRSYYFADPNSVVGAVLFLHSILPSKPLDELYTVLGRMRQGKTERYRIFTQHLQNTNDKFVHAEGDKGLVMIVFTLPSYDLVFKIIRDRFGYPKTISRNDVLVKYKLVSKHDRAGRLIDTQEFLNLELPIDRFSDEVCEDLLQNAAQSVAVQGDYLLLRHVYVERRVRPLNLYIKEVDKRAAELAILDYGQALKDLAQTNIFPGDLLLKNFGVTKAKRVIFYDYDEVSLVTECTFREIPEADDIDDEMRTNDWYYVAEKDIFPEEHIKFLSMEEDLRSLFLEVHSDLMTVDFWNRIRDQHLGGEAVLVVPYSRPSLPPGRN